MLRKIIGIAGIVLAASLALSPSVRAQSIQYWEPDRTITVEPRMYVVPQSDVYYWRDAEGYDLYRYGSSWYVIDNGRWYRAGSWRGPFVSIESGTVPRALVTIPVEYRRTWPGGYSDDRWRDRDWRDRDDRDRGYRVSTITFSKKPKMRLISGTDVYYNKRKSSVYDLYQFEGVWYLVDNGSWYRGGSWRGPFIRIQRREIPDEILGIPRQYRRFWSMPAYYGGDEGRRGYWESGRTFSREPHVRRIEDTRVYYRRDDSGFEMYRFLRTWYIVDRGGWYMADSWRGPFQSIRFRDVPDDIVSIPSRYRREWKMDED